MEGGIKLGRLRQVKSIMGRRKTEPLECGNQEVRKKTGFDPCFEQVFARFFLFS